MSNATFLRLGTSIVPLMVTTVCCMCMGCISQRPTYRQYQSLDRQAMSWFEEVQASPSHPESLKEKIAETQRVFERQSQYLEDGFQRSDSVEQNADKLREHYEVLTAMWRAAAITMVEESRKAATSDSLSSP